MADERRMVGTTLLWSKPHGTVPLGKALDMIRKRLPRDHPDLKLTPGERIICRRGNDGLSIWLDAWVEPRPAPRPTEPPC